jgi:hypothetical protein
LCEPNRHALEIGLPLVRYQLIQFFFYLRPRNSSNIAHTGFSGNFRRIGKSTVERPGGSPPAEAVDAGHSRSFGSTKSIGQTQRNTLEYVN